MVQGNAAEPTGVGFVEGVAGYVQEGVAGGQAGLGGQLGQGGFGGGGFG